MDYNEILQSARTCMGPYCKACPVCNGRACGNTIPGPGSKGLGVTFQRNYQKWQEICVQMDTICENRPADTSFDFFGKKLRLPVLAAPVGAMKMHYGDKYDDAAYNDLLVSACRDAGILAFTGDGMDAAVMEGALRAIHHADGCGVPTVKPWDKDTIFAKLTQARKADPVAVAMDIDAAGLPFLKNHMPPAGARKALEAGAAGIVVSNHGGRVLDQCPATAEVLPAIVEAVAGRMKIFVDGGIRTGLDVFKALALGADGVLIGRPFVTMVYGGGAEGVRVYADKLQSELQDAMQMCGVHTLKEITRDQILRP